MTLAFRSAETSPFVRALLEGEGIAPGALSLAIDGRDEMFEFLAMAHDGDRERGLFSYFRTGQSIADALLQIVRWRFGGLEEVKVLDFASGYGRVTRFLLQQVPAERIWVSDIYADGVRFQQEQLGVHGVVSTLLPEAFACGETFDAILVTSLFSHLREDRFVGWLRALLGLLRPGGILLFSVHDQALLDPAHEMPPEGILFQELSESQSLATSDYGTAWVSEEFVRRALARAEEGPLSVHRIPRGLCNFQDLYAAIREEGVGFSTLDFHSEPYLLIDRCDLAALDLLELRGWAAAASGNVREVQVLLDGRLVGSSPVEGERPDVAAQLGERFARSGWACSCRLPAGFSLNGSALVLRAVDGRGISQALWASTIQTLRLACSRAEVTALHQVLHQVQARLAEVEARSAAAIAGLNARIAAMEASRFWKMRNAWFALKRALGLTQET